MWIISLKYSTELSQKQISFWTAEIYTLYSTQKFHKANVNPEIKAEFGCFYTGGASAWKLSWNFFYPLCICVMILADIIPSVTDENRFSDLIWAP